MTLKKVVAVQDEASQHWVGDGFPVRTMFPSHRVTFDKITPFLMLDYAGPKHFEPSEQPRGVGEHPHRGFETVTIAYQGSVAHRDSSGSAGVIGPGDVQWMTAASGVVHEEMHEREFSRQGGTFEMVQLWVNLPKAHKMSKPGYQTLVSSDIPVEQWNGGSLRVIAGEHNGKQGPAKTFTPVGLFDLKLDAGGEAELTFRPGDTAALFLLNGDVTAGDTHLSGDAKLALLGAEGDSVKVKATADSRILVLSGEPIREPVAQYGPFVMNTREELAQAVEDYRAGRMGRLH